MHERRFDISKIHRLRSPERLEWLEIERVTNLVLSDQLIKSIADIGTGTGIFAETFHSHGIQAEGADVNAEMINNASSLVPDVPFSIAPAESLPWAGESFDAAFLGMVLHETDNPQSTLNEANRIAKKLVAILEWPDEEQSFGPPRKDRLSSEYIIKIAKKAGLKLIDETRLKFLVLYRFKSAKS
jgi:ubiquinone/menaquinone biosynthesis C-methylase UbiE